MVLLNRIKHLLRGYKSVTIGPPNEYHCIHKKPLLIHPIKFSGTVSTAQLIYTASIPQPM